MIHTPPPSPPPSPPPTPAPPAAPDPAQQLAPPPGHALLHAPPALAPDVPPGGLQPSNAIAGWIGLGMIAGVITGLVCLVSGAARAWVVEHLWWVLGCYAGGGVLLTLLASVPWARRRILDLSEATKSTLVVFLLIPLLVLTVLAVPVLDNRYRPAVIHAIFVLIVCLLPGVMYYLFIVSRRPSMLNEYVANLRRLGLIGAGNDGEDAGMRRRRVESYIQRFEAVYGPIRERREELINELAEPSGSGMIGSAGAFVYGPTRSADLAHVFPREVFVQMFITTVLLALGWLLVLPPVIPKAAASPDMMGPPDLSLLSDLRILIPVLSPVNMAFLGAYFFTLQMIFRRFIRRDLNVKVYVNTSIRIVLAVIGAWVVSVTWALGVQEADVDVSVLLASTSRRSSQSEIGVLIVAFAIGAFPRVLWQLVVSVFKRLPGISIALPSLESGQPLSELDGMTVWHEARLEEEDIENVENMATADPMELMLQTRLSPERLVRWVDQGILLMCLGKPADSNGGRAPRDELQAIGITTASDLYLCFRCEDVPGQGGLSESMRASCKNIRLALDGKAWTFALVRAWYRLDDRAEAEALEAARADTFGSSHSVKSRDVAAA